MSDTGLTIDSAPPAEAFSSTPVGDAPAGTTSATPASDPLADPTPEQAVFDRGYVESIRKEAQRYRGEAQTAAARAAQYDEVYGQYAPEDQAIWFDLARTWQQDPARAAQIMQQIATGVLGEGQPEMTDYRNEPEQQQFEDEGLTPDKVQAMIDAQFQTREQAAAEQRAVDSVMAEVRAAGYDPDSAEGFMVLWNANHETGGDITRAAEMVKGYRQSVIDEYVQGRTSGRAAMPAASGVQADSAPAPITNFDDARRAADRFLQGRRGA